MAGRFLLVLLMCVGLVSTVGYSQAEMQESGLNKKDTIKYIDSMLRRCIGQKFSVNSGYELNLISIGFWYDENSQSYTIGWEEYVETPIEGRTAFASVIMSRSKIDLTQVASISVEPYPDNDLLGVVRLKFNGNVVHQSLDLSIGEVSGRTRLTRTINPTSKDTISHVGFYYLKANVRDATRLKKAILHLSALDKSANPFD